MANQANQCAAHAPDWLVEQPAYGLVETRHAPNEPKPLVHARLREQNLRGSIGRSGAGLDWVDGGAVYADAIDEVLTAADLDALPLKPRRRAPVPPVTREPVSLRDFVSDVLVTSIVIAGVGVFALLMVFVYAAVGVAVAIAWLGRQANGTRRRGTARRIKK